jgi:hypothetical protein
MRVEVVFGGESHGAEVASLKIEHVLKSLGLQADQPTRSRKSGSRAARSPRPPPTRVVFDVLAAEGLATTTMTMLRPGRVRFGVRRGAG